MKDLISTFVLTLLIFFRETCPLVEIKQENWFELFCFETKTSFKKYVFWSKKFVLSDTNSLEQFANDPEVDEFT